jgi:ABC-type antimicrobial peptide transport system permease subunit
MLVRVRGDVGAAAEALRVALQRELRGDSYITVQRLDEIVGREQRSWRLGATLLLLFGGLALAVATVGLFGMVAYEVAQRTHELGVRVALGATPARVLRLVVGNTTRLMVVGVGGGCAMAWALRGVVQPLLFRQSATDPTVYVAVATLMAVVAVTASLAPALRAAKADPMHALRGE